MTKLKIKVTKEILEKSKHCGTIPGVRVIDNCPVALAVRDIFPKASVIGTIYPFGFDTKKYERGIKMETIPLTQEVRWFIVKFDEANPSERISLPELEFEVHIPDSIIEKINIDELRPLLINHPTLELVG